MQQTVADIQYVQPITLLWFYFDQNNSGGYFISNAVVSEDVFIQARNAEEAMAKAGELFEPYSEYCECCGERWPFYVKDSDGTPTPVVYDERLEDVKPGMFRKEARLHHFDGHVEAFTYGQPRQGVIAG